MKITLSLLLLFSPFLSLSIRAAEKPVESNITDVTVYPDRAIVTRTATTSLQPGEHDIAFGGLPANIDESSIRARGTGSGLKIMGVQIKRDFVEIAEPEQVKTLKDQIEKLEQSNQDLNDENNDLNQKRSLLETLSKQAGQPDKDGETEVSVADIKNLVEYYGQERLVISRRLREIERTQQDNQEAINKLRGELNTLQGNRGPRTRKVVVTVKASKSVSPKIQIDYLVYGASWSPQYDVYAKTTDPTIEFTTYGIVRQTTGEDWKDVKLTLSTARPQQGTSVPDLSPWVVDFPQPVSPPESDLRGRSFAMEEERSNVAAPGQAKSRSLAVAAMGGEDKMEVAEQATSSITQKGFSAVFNVPGSMDVPSDNDTHRCTIAIRKMKSERSYIAIPKLASGAFVKAKVQNDSAAPLLPGPINLFMEGDFIGRSFQTMVGPEGYFDVFLGKDDAVKVTRTEKVRKEDVSGVINKTRSVRLGFDIEVENFHQQAVTITVEDQLPVSKNTEIRINSSQLKPKPDEQDKETGKLSWKLTIEPKKKEAIEVIYDISTPAEKPAVGF